MVDFLFGQNVYFMCSLPPPPPPLPLPMPNYIKSSHVKSSQVKSSRVKSSRVESSQGYKHPRPKPNPPRAVSPPWTK